MFSGKAAAEDKPVLDPDVEASDAGSRAVTLGVEREAPGDAANGYAGELAVERTSRRRI